MAEGRFTRRSPIEVLYSEPCETDLRMANDALAKLLKLGTVDTSIIHTADKLVERH
jgi:hypothetical protein